MAPDLVAGGGTPPQLAAADTLWWWCPREVSFLKPASAHPSTTLPRRTKSRYNPAAESTQVSDIRPARLLGGNAGAADGAERTEAQAMIQRCDQVRSLSMGPLRACDGNRGAKCRWAHCMPAGPESRSSQRSCTRAAWAPAQCPALQSSCAGAATRTSRCGKCRRLLSEWPN